MPFAHLRSAIQVGASAPPADPEANIKLLEKGSDPKLKALAEQEIKGPADADQQVQLADAWWDLGQKEAGIALDSLRLHAANIYQAALPRVASVLKKAAIEKRLAEIPPRKLVPISTTAAPAMMALVIAFTGVLFLIVDLDRSNAGFLRLDQTAMSDLQRSMHATETP